MSRQATNRCNKTASVAVDTCLRTFFFGPKMQTELDSEIGQLDLLEVAVVFFPLISHLQSCYSLNFYRPLDRHAFHRPVVSGHKHVLSTVKQTNKQRWSALTGNR